MKKGPRSLKRPCDVGGGGVDVAVGEPDLEFSFGPTRTSPPASRTLERSRRAPATDSERPVRPVRPPCRYQSGTDDRLPHGVPGSAWWCYSGAVSR